MELPRQERAEMEFRHEWARIGRTTSDERRATCDERRATGRVKQRRRRLRQCVLSRAPAPRHGGEETLREGVKLANERLIGRYEIAHGDRQVVTVVALDSTVREDRRSQPLEDGRGNRVGFHDLFNRISWEARSIQFPPRSAMESRNEDALSCRAAELLSVFHRRRQFLRP